jgi:quercetin dioxygenase-like cupin family protein
MLTTIIECVDLDAELAFFRDVAECRVHLVSPADDPRRVVLYASSGGAVELVRADVDRPAVITIDAERSDRLDLVSPSGSVVTMRSVTERMNQPFGAAMEVPTNAATLAIVAPSDGSFGPGRAGMEYRDLLPDRWGGRFIASHIRITEGGDVADWVHFHKIRFQMIYVAAGWVDVVYEDQGEPFRMTEGDCVLQPPEIRHRVLRNSPGLEVIEIGCPAEHDTITDHDLDLPTASIDADRVFSGQRFVRHVANDVVPRPWVATDMAARDTGIDAATGGLAGAVVVGGGFNAGSAGPMLTHHGEFVLVVGLSGNAMLDVGGRAIELAPRASVALPAGTCWSWTTRSDEHSALIVTLPADTVDLV